jgi:hypothetical protein
MLFRSKEKCKRREIMFEMQRRRRSNEKITREKKKSF